MPPQASTKCGTHIAQGLLSQDAPPDGTRLPPGYHLVYFTPNGVESQLGRDGTDTAYNAPEPFTRRMWAGGRMRWVKGRDLRVGEVVEERTRIVSAEPKVSRSGSEMVMGQRILG